VQHRVVIVQRRLARFRRDFFARLAESRPGWRVEVCHGGAFEGGEPEPIPGVALRSGGVG
jgi:hypothetical protein